MKLIQQGLRTNCKAFLQMSVKSLLGNNVLRNKELRKYFKMWLVEERVASLGGTAGNTHVHHHCGYLNTHIGMAH